MNLLDAIKDKRNRLNETSTAVTYLSGKKYLVKIKDATEAVEQLESSLPGYIIDERPDLQVAVILPYLFLGSQDVTSIHDLLQMHNITSVLSIGVHPLQKFPQIQYYYLDLLDLPESSLSTALTTAYNIIEHACSSNSRIFLHCNAGYSRAPSIVIGYLMKKFHYSYDVAFEMVKKVRLVSPNVGFVQQLKLL